MKNKHIIKNRKLRRALMALALVLTALCCVAGLVIMALPDIGTMRDLGVVYSEGNYTALRERVLIDYVGFSDTPKDVMKLDTEGVQDISLGITNEQMSAFLCYSPLFSPFIKKAQVLSSEDGCFEFSAKVDLEKLIMFLPEESVSYLPGIAVRLAGRIGDIAVYGKIRADVKGGKVNDFTLLSLSVMGIDVMQYSGLLHLNSDLSGDMEYILNNYIGDYGIYLDTLTPRDGEIYIKGSLPKRIISD